ncbi:MAG: dTDP-4-dehydrorhamnose 3,5-epimerase family protein [Acidobacteriota bacterium]
MSLALPSGVSMRPLRRIVDARGVVMRMLRADDAEFQAFGEIYFSGVQHGAVKGWRRHRYSTSNLAVPVGEIRLVLVDLREESPTRGLVADLALGESNYCLVTVPPGLWTAWEGRAAGLSLVANCASLPHDPAEVDAADLDDPRIPSPWRRA